MPPRQKRDLPFEWVLFRRKLLHWFRRNGRDLPWRHTRDPYAVVISEFMLQQTRVGVVIPYYNRWLRRFPEFAALAHASENDVLHAWQGLGYYARPRNLHDLARTVIDRHGGWFPNQIDEMRKLPGIGKYTANAIATFAFDQSVPIVEANTARVLTRIFNVQTTLDRPNGRAQLWERASLLVPKRSARAFNSALVDLGAMICLPKPKCGICPVKTFCRARNPEMLPHKRARPLIQRLVEDHAFSIRKNKILLEQSQKRWQRMWILPTIKSKSEHSRPIFVLAFPFTNHRITLRVFQRAPSKIDKKRQRWFAPGKLNSIPIPSPHRRAIEHLLMSSGK